MLANAIDEPSVLSRSVEACSPFSKTNQGRREEEEERKRGEQHQWTVMESGEESEDASTADRLRPLSMVWEH
ncbi:hypothetical protein CesoFtcFv8_008589 [Champsocephalus esox]|uniref:Uncharacterized protein n=1 Tax=Champsocephalus esox TaxID=159716 RepID=A0AAN8CBR4_9TELE|nr:hypothetical protein CesoFtcFv8_008589 [Champsocephalus esox]